MLQHFGFSLFVNASQILARRRSLILAASPAAEISVGLINQLGKVSFN
jgi:hypothetical protein